MGLRELMLPAGEKEREGEREGEGEGDGEREGEGEGDGESGKEWWERLLSL